MHATEMQSQTLHDGRAALVIKFTCAAPTVALQIEINRLRVVCELPTEQRCTCTGMLCILACGHRSQTTKP